MTPADTTLTPQSAAAQAATLPAAASTATPAVSASAPAPTASADPAPVPLQFPVTKGDGTKLTTITLRRATVKELRRMKRFGPDPADQELGTVAELAGLIPEDLDMVDARDYAKVQKCFRELVGGDS